ncbi:thiol-disulfide oxidoreductase ResA [Lederbergia graminis]|uniref:Thiol-disulfide oxidoreductase ResA n=1 Tax=Lederbergia graminis TaxID=735518 RepID=A0ABW0LBK9_9BACI|nr:thiol-disulfide oxidoreductase ResA [Paenibacillus bovis]HLU23774.1 thiol-disulfide oxidoreductase ResA [Bacillaceae bacterium]
MANKKKKRLVIRTIILSIMAIAVAYTLYASFTKDKHSKVTVGDKAPNFSLVDMNGDRHELSDYKGKGIFLNFWGTYCEPCKDEMPDMENQYKVYKDQGVEILAVNVGEPDYFIEKFLDKYPLSFPVLKDKNRDVRDVYNIYNLPATFLINPEGEIIKIEEGRLTEEKIAAMMESIKP